MKAKFRQSGVTLTEMTVVVAVIVLLVAFGLPAVRTLHNSFESGASARALIRAGLAAGRAIAAREQRYAGIRFQQDLSQTHQYMIFIIHDPTLVDDSGYTVPSSGFRVFEGLQPVGLPEMVSVMERVANVGEIDEPDDVRAATTFSVVFSPTGRLVVRDVQLLRRNADDGVFNDPSTDPMFQDDYDNDFPYQGEQSQNSFTICDRTLFDKLDTLKRFDYLQSLEPIHINAYTGTIIKPGKGK